MGNPELKNENIDDIITVERVKELKNEILEKKKNGTDPHFKYIDIAQLTAEDFAIYDKFKKGILTTEDFNRYSEKLKQLFKEEEYDCKDKIEMVKKLRDDFNKKKINEEDFRDAFKKLMQESDEERSTIGEEAIQKCNSRANFEAMIRNWMIDKMVDEKKI